MRISGIDKFLGGANNVKALEMIRGEKRTFTGTVKDSTGAVVDISAGTFSATAEFYKATVESSGKTISVLDITTPSTAIADKVIVVTKATDTSTGQFSLVLPADLAADTDTAPLDASTEVLIAAVYITYDFGGTDDIRKSRMIVVIRHSA